jgi:D-arabinose 5-phosphate isomerase GutQ
MGLGSDIDMLRKNDVVTMLSYSGETEEIKKVFLVLRKMKIKVMVMNSKIKV